MEPAIKMAEEKLDYLSSDPYRVNHFFRGIVHLTI